MRSSNISLVHNLNSIVHRYEYLDPFYNKFVNVVGLPDYIKWFASGIVRMLGMTRILNHLHSLRRMNP